MKRCRHPKRKPYGTKGTEPYCRPHDSCSVYNISKKTERNKAKQEINNSLHEALFYNRRTKSS